MIVSDCACSVSILDLMSRAPINIVRLYSIHTAFIFSAPFSSTSRF